MKPSRAAAIPGAWIAVLLGVVLAAPGLGLGYFWDDILFLTRIQAEPTAYLLPDPAATFYRPLSQGIYFLVLSALGPGAAIAAHLANLALLAAAIYLVVALVARLAGERAGLLAGLVFAASSCVPSLVAWVSAAQDLGAVFFLIVAYRLRDEGCSLGSLAATAAALLCKETALLSLPVLVLWDRILGRRHPRIGVHAAWFGGLAIAWAAAHPGLHALVAHGFRAGATGYVGLEEPERWAGFAARYLLTAWNVPFTVSVPAWPGRLTLACVAGLVLIGAWFRSERKASAPAGAGAEAKGGLIPSRAIVLAAWIALPAIALPAFLVRPWAAYFVALPAVGVAIAGGVLLARLPASRATLALAAYLVLGVFARGIVVPGERIWTERAFVDASRAARRVEAAFHDLEPELPPGAHVLLSIGATGTLGIYQTLHDNQALRLWYGDPSLVTRSPEQRRPSPAPEFLFRVTPDLTVIAIDPKTAYFRASGGRATLDQVALPLRAYARGLAASGEPERAAELLGRLARLDPPPLRAYDLRVAAAALRLAGRAAAAESLRGAAPPLRVEEARDMVGQILAEPSASEAFDDLSWWAFDVSPTDPEALRYLIGQYRIGGYRRPALAMARRLAAVAPGDSLARAVIGEHEPGSRSR